MHVSWPYVYWPMGEAACRRIQKSQSAISEFGFLSPRPCGAVKSVKHLHLQFWLPNSSSVHLCDVSLASGPCPIGHQSSPMGQGTGHVELGSWKMSDSEFRLLLASCQLLLASPWGEPTRGLRLPSGPSAAQPMSLQGLLYLRDTSLLDSVSDTEARQDAVCMGMVMIHGPWSMPGQWTGHVDCCLPSINSERRAVECELRIAINVACRAVGVEVELMKVPCAPVPVGTGRKSQS